MGIIGFAQCHGDMGLCFARHPAVEMAACADTVPLVAEGRKFPGGRLWDLERTAREANIPRVHDDWRKVLDEEGLDIAIVQCENARHAEVVEACAARGVHVCLQHPLATSLDEGRRMAAACRAAGLSLMSRWPPVFEGWFHAMRGAVQEGKVGCVLEFKLRYGYRRGPVGREAPLAAGGPPLTDEELAGLWWNQRASGGGAIMDFAGFGTMYALHFIGDRARSVFALAENLNTPWADVPDHAHLVIAFPGAVAAVESVWNGGPGGYPSGPFLSGTDGTLSFETIEGPRRGVVLRRMDGTSETLPDRPPAVDRADLATEFIRHLGAGEPLHPVLDLAFNLDVMAVLDAATRSAASGRREAVAGTTPAS